MAALPDRRLNAYREDLADARLMGRVEAARFVEPIRARIGIATAPLRPRPDRATRLDSEVLFGEEVELFERRDGWAWVRTLTDGYVGYLPDAALSEGPGRDATHVVAVPRTLRFDAPDIKTPEPLGLSFLSRLAVAEINGRFARLADGGFVPVSHIAPLGQILQPDWAGTAERFLGVPYLWGGRSSLGLDCSALTQLALAAAGIAAPRDSDLQEAGFGAALTITADYATLRRGDLLFWKGHVAICLGEGLMIHANAGDMMVASGRIAAIAARIEAAGGGVITSARRPSAS